MQLKRKIAIALCSFYLISVIGVALSFHFCGGRLASVSAVSTPKGCKFCASEKKTGTEKDCCKDTSLHVKVDDSHRAAKTISAPDFFGFTTFLPAGITELFTRILPVLFTVETVYETPPDPSGIALNIMHCVFRN